MKSVTARTHLRSTPLHTHHKQCDTNRTQDTTDVVDLAKNVASSVLLGQTRGVLVAEDAEKQADEVPDTDEDTVHAPVAGFGDHLGVKHRWAEGKNGKDNESDVLATVFDGHDFSSSSECDELVESGSNARKDVSG